MPGVVFRRLDLRFGCHERSFELPEGPSPVVVAGPNGSGKSTLVEALARTLFGFNMQRGEDRALWDGRRPWGGEECYGHLTFRAADGHDWRLERDFSTHDARLRRVDGTGEEFEGDANPAGGNPEAVEFRRRLRLLFGLPRLAQYVSTTCIGQGAVGETRLSHDLLEAASGGRIDVDEARSRIEEAHRELTRGPIRTGQPAGRKDRRLEELEGEIEELEGRLRQAEAAHRSRAPLLQERAELRERLRKLEVDLERIDAAVGPLSRRRSLRLEAEGCRRRIRRLEEAEHRLSRAFDAEREAAAELEERMGPGEYPRDFRERLARLEGLWDRRRELGERLESLESEEREIRVPALWTVVVAGGVAALGGLAWFLGNPLLAGVLAVPGGIGVIYLLVARNISRREREARRAERTRMTRDRRGLEERITAQLHGIPRDPELTPSTADRHRERFRRQAEARARLEDARRELEEAEDRAESILRETRSAGVEIPDPGSLGGDDPTRPLRLAAGEVRNELARQELALRELRRIDLPEGISEDLDAVEKARDARRAETRTRSEELEEIQREILESRPSESPVALEDELKARRAERDDVARRVEEYRRAWALLVDSHEAFRADDEERLLRAVSDELRALSDGAFGPLVADDGLESVRLRAFDRVVPLTYRPLSFGQHLTVLLAVRLGIADFLAQAQIRVPLLVDEPFAHLDDDNALAVWDRLLAVSEGRQVLVTTQETRLLDRMGVEPDIRLEPG